MDEPMEQYKKAEKLELKDLKKEEAKKFQKINCPSCDAEIDSNDVNLQNVIAKCSTCNVIFSIEEEMESVKTKNEIKQQFLRPEGIDLFYYEDELDISLSQHIRGFDAWLIGFSPLIAVGAFMNFFIAENPIPLYFPIAFTLVAMYFIYKAIVYSKYKTYIDINDRHLSVKHRPQNFKKDKLFAADDIDQIYLRHSPEGGGYYVIFALINGFEGQKHEKLLTVNSLSKAKYLEQEIERYLNIMDRAVPEATV